MEFDLRQKGGVRYAAVRRGKPLKKGKDYAFSPGDEIVLTEKNPFLSRFWWLYVLIRVLLALFSSGEDFSAKDEKLSQTRLTLRLKALTGERLTIDPAQKTVLGADGTWEVSTLDRSDLIKRRLKIGKISLLILVLALLAAAAALILTAVFG